MRIHYSINSKIRKHNFVDPSLLPFKLFDETITDSACDKHFNYYYCVGCKWNSQMPHLTASWLNYFHACL